MTVLANTSEQLPFLSSEERLAAYQIILDGCSHVWSKGELQEEGAQKMLDALIPLTQSDPYFLAHLTSYAMKKTNNKDLQSFCVLANSLSSADGQPFSPGSKYMKPNLRYVSAAALHMLDVQMASRVLKLVDRPYSSGHLKQAVHFPTFMVTAFKKYLKYREANLDIVRGLKEAGLAQRYMQMYKALHMAPSTEVAGILKWDQKDGREIKFEDSPFKSFETMTDLEIAEKIRAEKLNALGVINNLPRAVSPVIAVAILEQATGNQAVILRRLFDEAGVLADPEVMKLYEEKIATAKTALDRAETLSQGASEAVKQALKTARSDQRKAATAGIGKIYLHLDLSASMEAALKFAVERGAILAECVNDPANNFKWGYFSTTVYSQELPLPQEFVADAFAAQLFGKTVGGATDAFALYPKSREFGSDVDVFVTDQDHNVGVLFDKIREYHVLHPEHSKPKTVVIVDFSGGHCNTVKRAFEENNIPVSVLKPDALTESALVIEAVKTALMGPVAVIDDIMSESLLELPKYYYAI